MTKEKNSGSNANPGCAITYAKLEILGEFKTEERGEFYKNMLIQGTAVKIADHRRNEGMLILVEITDRLFEPVNHFFVDLARFTGFHLLQDLERSGAEFVEPGGILIVFKTSDAPFQLGLEFSVLFLIEPAQRDYRFPAAFFQIFVYLIHSLRFSS